MIDRLSQLNPLRGLTLDGLVRHLEMGEQGYYADLQWLYRFILKRNATGRAVRRKLAGSLGKLDWDIKIRSDAAGFDEAKANAQQKTLRTAYERIGNLRKSWAHLAMADILGFAHCEKIHAGHLARQLKSSEPARAEELAALPPLTVVELRPVPQWHMRRLGLFAPWCYDRKAEPTNTGAPIPLQHWIVREVDDPAAEIFAWAHIRMSVTDADWDQFCDTYAVPPIFLEGPPGVSREKEAAYQQTANEIVSDGRGYIPHGAKPHILDARGGSGSPFTERLRYFREEIVLAGTGGILTTLDGNTGIGKGPAEEHDDTWLAIAAEIGGNVSEVYQEQFDAGILRSAHPGEPHLAYFELQKPAKDSSPSIILGDAKLAGEAGYEMDENELSEKSGYTLTKKAVPAPASAVPGSAPASGAGSGAPPDPGIPTAANPPAVTEPAAAEPAARLPPGEAPAATRETRALPSASGQPKPSIVEAALAEDLDVDARVFAPVKPALDALEQLILDGADPEEIIAKAEALLTQLPEILGMLDVAALADALEKASGPAAIQGVRDAIAGRAAPRA
jgi:hypothetical protein